ncbi:probable fructokinase-5 [Tanacetum coccineum]
MATLAALQAEYTTTTTIDEGLPDLDQIWSDLMVAMISGGNEYGKVHGYSVKAIDTTGAGDSFVGTLLVSMAKDGSIFTDEAKLKQALAISNARGAICTTKK